MLLEIDGTLILAAISFVLFAIVMNFIFYKPIQNIIEKREIFLEEEKSLSRSNFETKSKLSKKMDGEILLARKESREELAQKTAELKAEKAGKVKDASEIARQGLEVLCAKMQDEVDEVKNELDSGMAEYKQLLASKFFDESVVSSTLRKGGGV